MCHLSMKLFETLDEKPPCTFDTILKLISLNKLNNSYDISDLVWLNQNYKQKLWLPPVQEWTPPFETRGPVT